MRPIGPPAGLKSTRTPPLRMTASHDRCSSDKHADQCTKNGAHILVVDDDPSILTLVTEILLDQGYQVAAVRNVEEALQRIQDKARRPRVLVVLDRPVLADLVLLTLNHVVCTVRTATTPELAGNIATAWQPDVLILDMALDGLRTMRQARAVAVSPVFVMGLVERGDLSSKLAAIYAGVDDILAVPFAPDELLARTIALTRRSKSGAIGVIPAVTVGELQIDILNRTVRIGDSAIHLTAAELSLLYLLAATPGRLVTNQEILTTLWGTSQTDKLSVVDQYVRNLRALLPTEDRRPIFIAAADGRGYRFLPFGSDQLDAIAHH
jgi:two-component system, OmpR family, KDP operon response regulator KdpE